MNCSQTSDLDDIPLKIRECSRGLTLSGKIGRLSLNIMDFKEDFEMEISSQILDLRQSYLGLQI